MSDDSRPRFTYLGHSTVRFTLAGGEVVLIDPWVEGNPACPPEARRFERLDAVLISHGHGDHMGDAVELCRRLRPKVVVGSWEICHWLSEKGVQNTSGMNLGGTQEVLGMRVTMVRADHSSSILDDGLLLDGGPAAGYVVRTAEGFVFYHAGDTALYSDMQLLRDLYRPRLAFLPIGDHFTMDPRQAAMACRFLGVREVVPIHYGTFPLLGGTPDQLEEHLADLGADCEVIAIRPGESY